MTISGALTNAMSGLRAAGRGAELVSSNISNALTPGYGRRVLGLSSSSIGDSGGVQINGIMRIVDASLASDKRLAGAEQLNAQGTADFYQRFESLLGSPDDPSSISARLAGFESSLITAASRPDAPERLLTAVSEAQGVVHSLRTASEGIQDARTVADHSIGNQVDQLNASLDQMVALNHQITAAQVQGGEIASLQDQRQLLIDRVSEIVPVREVPRDNGQIALYSIGGAVLLDQTAAEIGFERSNVVTPYMSLAANTLSGLTINGNAVRTGSDNGLLRGGSLSVQFAIRDDLGVEAQTQVDILARDLVERFQDPAVDPTLSAGNAGLFTDGGNPFAPIDERGLSDRLELNSAVDPENGGEVWRIRDGINALVSGPIGSASLLQSLGEALDASRVPSSGNFGGGSFNLANLVSTINSGVGSARTIAETELSFASARFTELTERQLADGVDTDQEISHLLVIEQAYAANARVIQAVDEMMQTILRL